VTDLALLGFNPPLILAAFLFLMAAGVEVAEEEDVKLAFSTSEGSKSGEDSSESQRFPLLHLLP